MYLPVGPSGHDRPYYVSRPGAMCPWDKGRWPQQATGGCKLGHTMTKGSAALCLPQSRGQASPCVTLALLTYLIKLGEGSDST